jgi:uncharacterized protein YegL
MENIFDSFEKEPNRQLPIFFLIDKSKSMEGSKIGTVNNTMREILEELKNEGVEGEEEADIKLSILAFSTGFQWLTPVPQSPSDVQWVNLVADGLTDLEDALKELDQKMSRKEFIKSVTSTFAPIIIILTDGDPDPGWENGLRKCRENKWFLNARILALPIGTEFKNPEILVALTGKKEWVLEPVTSPAQLRKALKKVVLTASKIGSQSRLKPGEVAEDSWIKLISDINQGTSTPDVPDEIPQDVTSQGSDDGVWDNTPSPDETPVNPDDIPKEDDGGW